MISVNSIILGGNLGADPEERRTASGKLVCNFRIATNRWDARAEETTADWHSIVVYDKHAEPCVKFLRKGSPVLVEGRLAQREWEGQDGKKRTTYEVIANRVSFLGTGRGAAPERLEVVADKAQQRDARPFVADAVPF